MMLSLRAAPPRLTRTERVADKVVARAQMDSTHEQAHRLVDAGLIAWNGNDDVAVTVVAADVQTDAHVRYGRNWMSVPGGSFTVSFIATMPDAVVRDSTMNGWLSMIAGLATLDAIEGALDDCGARPLDPDYGFMLKWPNDIYCHGLKLGSTYSEIAQPPEGSRERGKAAVIFSVGVNLTVPADRLPTPQSTSLSMHVKSLPMGSVLRDMIAARLVVSLRERLKAFIADPAQQSSRLRSETRHVCWMMGRTISERLTDGTVCNGEVVALNDDASVTVRASSGEVRVLRISDVGLLT